MQKSEHGGHLGKHVKLDVLLIEHNDRLADTFRIEMQQFRADVHRAERTEDALRLIEGKKLDAVFVEIDHPDLNSYRIITAVRNSPSNYAVPIVALVPEVKLALLENASRAGATHFLPKPIVWGQMHQLMQSIHWRMVDDRRRYRRAKATIPVLCTFKGRQAVGKSIDISATGMLLQVEEDLPIGSEILSVFPYSERFAASFLLHSRVARHVNRGSDGRWVAVEFTDITSDRSERLLMWVDLFYYLEETAV